MNGLKKWMVVLMTGVTLMGNVIGMGTTVIASKNETQESLSGVNQYKARDNYRYDIPDKL